MFRPLSALVQKIKSLPKRTLIFSSLIILVIIGGIIAIILNRSSANQIAGPEGMPGLDATGIYHQGEGR